MSESSSATVLSFDGKRPSFERRRFPRVAASEIRARPAGRRFELLDLSQRGMAIRALHAFSVGGNYLFELREDDRSLLLEGQIRSCERLPIAGGRAELDGGTAFRAGVSIVGIQDRSTPSTGRATLVLPRDVAPTTANHRQVLANRIERLRRAESADEAAELLLELLSVAFAHLVLFRFRDREITAWMGRGPNLVPERLKELRVSADRASIFLHLEQGGSFFYGRLPAMFLDLQLLRCWDGSLERECTLFPIRIRHRLVAILYADAGERGISSHHLRTLRKSTDLFSRSLMDLILRRRAAVSPEQS